MTGAGSSADLAGAPDPAMMRASRPAMERVPANVALISADHVVEGGLAGQHLADLLFLLADVVLAHQRGDVAERGVGLVLLVDQAAQHPQVARERLGVGVEQQRGDLRRVPLAVPVDAPVALLDPDQAPRDVEVDQLVALGVQVDALGGDVAGDQDPDRVRRPA